MRAHHKIWGSTLPQMTKTAATVQEQASNPGLDKSWINCGMHIHFFVLSGNIYISARVWNDNIIHIVCYFPYKCTYVSNIIVDCSNESISERDAVFFLWHPQTRQWGSVVLVHVSSAVSTVVTPLIPEGGGCWSTLLHLDRVFQTSFYSRSSVKYLENH